MGNADTVLGTRNRTRTAATVGSASASLPPSAGFS